VVLPYIKTNEFNILADFFKFWELKIHEWINSTRRASQSMSKILI